MGALEDRAAEAVLLFQTVNTRTTEDLQTLGVSISLEDGSRLKLDFKSGLSSSPSF